jgi:hypothetical protein
MKSIKYGVCVNKLEIWASSKVGTKYAKLSNEGVYVNKKQIP